jgi:hypothetical protein
MGTLKTFTDIKFFLKTADTTTAFNNTEFFGPDDGDNIVYPTEDFDDNTTLIGTLEHTEQELCNDYEVTFNESSASLGQADVENDNEVNAATNIFTNAVVGDFLLYKLQSDPAGTSLKVLGIISVKNSDSSVTLENDAPEANNTAIDVYYISKNAPILNFNFADNFYMLVKNNDFTTGGHNGVLAIDTLKTTSPTASPLFAFGTNRTANTTYFKFLKISKKNSPGISDVSVIDVPCSIKGISKYSEKSAFQNLPATPVAGAIPYWSAYEVNPYLNTSTNLDKNTVYRIIIPDSLPSDRILVSGGGGGGS